MTLVGEAHNNAILPEVPEQGVHTPCGLFNGGQTPQELDRTKMGGGVNTFHKKKDKARILDKCLT